MKLDLQRTPVESAFLTRIYQAMICSAGSPAVEAPPTALLLSALESWSLVSMRRLWVSILVSICFEFSFQEIAFDLNLSQTSFIFWFEL